MILNSWPSPGKSRVVARDSLSPPCPSCWEAGRFMSRQLAGRFRAIVKRLPIGPIYKSNPWIKALSCSQIMPASTKYHGMSHECNDVSLNCHGPSWSWSHGMECHAWNGMWHGMSQPWNNHVTSIMGHLVMVNCHHVTIEHANMSTCHPSAMPCAKQCWAQTGFGLSRMFK